MQNLPRNVFRVCPDAPQTVAPVPVKKYNVIGGSEVLRVCEQQITIDDLKKAAKCARFDFFRAYTVMDVLLSETDFPTKRNVYIKRAMKPAVGSKTRVFSVCESTSVAPTPVRRPVVGGFNIVRQSNGEVLRVCENQITIDDLKKAAKCAKFEEFRVYSKKLGNSTNMLSTLDFPIQRDVYITRAIKVAKTKQNKTRIFSICESTSIPPRRTTPVPVSVPVPPQPKNTGKKKILNTAITALKAAINALEELSRTL